MAENECNENIIHNELSNCALITIHTNKTYLNICKVANYISTRKDYFDKATEIRLKTIPSRNIYVNVDLNSDTNLAKANLTLTPYDLAVMDAAHTLYLCGLDTFSPAMILRVMSGNCYQDATRQKVDSITHAINKLRHMDIVIDYSAEARLRKLIPKDGKAIINSYLLPVEDMVCRSTNGHPVHSYRLIEESALYTYASKINQIISVPASILDTHDSSLSDTDEVIVIKRYLVKRIEGMKNKKNNLISKDIVYSWYDVKTHSQKGLLYDLGIYPDNYSESSWVNKKSHIHHTIVKILDCFVAKGYIASYKEIRGSKSSIKGVSLCV